MNKLVEEKVSDQIEHEFESWSVNTGSKTIHAKRMPGRFRTWKYMTGSFWIVFFIGPYLRWNGKQMVLFDIANRQFHFMSTTILPQDIWMLSLVLLFLAMTLFAVTSVASRVFCGYFCFQTVWTDLFTWLEEKVEGNFTQRRKLDAAPWTGEKVTKKVIKHFLWLLVAILTGVSFSIWFVDAFEYWNNLLHFNLPPVGWTVLIAFILGTYLLAGFLREQACMWLCPYARIQAVMTDSQTILPTYDVNRGEPRGKIRRGAEAADSKQGDCIDCFQCVQVCPTGVDIRQGNQLGCITCGLCLDACDAIMDKVGRPRGLIRYASLDEMNGKPVKKLYQHTRTMVYLGIISIALMGIVYGLTHLGNMTLRVIPERQPLYVVLSDGSIRNRYEFKVLNKTPNDLHVQVSAVGGVEGQVIVGAETPVLTHHGRGTSFTIFVKAPSKGIKAEETPIEFHVQSVEDKNITAQYSSKFMAPKP